MLILKKISRLIKIIFKRYRWWVWGILNILAIFLLSLIIGTLFSLSVLTEDGLTEHQMPVVLDDPRPE